MKALFKLSVIILTTLLIDGCKKDEKTVSPPLPGNEFLTSVRLTATNAADPTEVKTAIITDTSIISNPPANIQQPVLALKANATYHVTVEFLDETKTPEGKVTDDIYDRRNYHLVCFDVAGANLTATRTDMDTNNPPLPIGLQDDFKTGAASTGTLNVQLRHQPNAKNGTCTPGSSDADVTFTVNIN